MKYEEKLEDPGSIPLDLTEIVNALTDLSSQLTKADDNLLKAAGEHTKLVKMMSDVGSNKEKEGFSLEDL